MIDQTSGFEIREARAADWRAIWPIFRDVVAAGDSFAYPPDSTEAQARAFWFSASFNTYVAVAGETIIGSYLIKPNQPGLGSHIANGAFMVSPEHAGRGVGRAMGEHAIQEATNAGYLAMQFNLVVRTNTRAVNLWKSLGFEIIGTIPGAFRHSRLGYVDAYIMYRAL